MRLRTLEQAHAELMSVDPSCALAKTALRRMVVSGQIPSVRIGAKYLVDIDRLQEYLFPKPSESKSETEGKVRPVNIH